MKIKITAILLVCAMTIGFVLSGCGNGEKTSAQESTADTVENSVLEESQTGENADNADKEPVKITFWHAMNTDVITNLVDKFNESQDEIYVECIYQGSYGDVLNAFKLAMMAGGADAPDVVQVYEGGSAFMIESGYATPVQKYIDEEGFDTSVLLPIVENYYTFNGTMYSMPFNCSNAVLYYNKDMFAAAGLDPENPPATFAELGEAAKKLQTSEVAGMALPIDCSLFEFNMVNIGQEIVNNGNGRVERATEAVFAQNGGGLKVFEAYNALYETGAVMDFGSDSLKAFIAQKTAMTLSSSSLASIVEKSVAGSFEVGVGAIPLIDESVNCGIPVGGGTLWLANKGDTEKEKAAFEFLKYMIEPETQAEWHMATGYYAINTQTYELEEVKAFHEANPLFKIAVDQIMNSNLEAVGPVYGVNMEARSKIQDHWRAMMEKSETPEQAIAAAEAEITELIKQYNLTNPIQ